MADAKEKQKQKEINKRKDEYKQAGKAYKKMLKPLKSSKFPAEFIEKSKAQFLQEYKEVVEDYLQDEDMKNEAISEEFTSLVDYYKGSSQSAAGKESTGTQEGVGGISGLIRKGIKDAGEDVLGEGNEELESNASISGGQMKGLKDISRWMLRNMDKTGIIGDSKAQFVQNYILRQPARLKLCAYYLVETDARKLSGEKLREAVVESQSSRYVPNLERFKSKMLATKFKFWKRFDGSQFYWEKLSESMRYAVAHAPDILKIGDLGSPEVTASDGAGGDQDSEGKKDSEKKQTDGTGSGAGSPASSEGGGAKIAYARFKLLENMILDQLKKKETLKKQNKWTQDDQNKLDLLVKDYAQSGKTISEAVRDGLIGDIEAEEVEGYEAEDGKISKGQDIADVIGGTVIGTSGDIVSADKLLKIVKDEKHTTRMEASGNWLGTISGVVSFGILIADVVRMAKKDSYVSGTTKVEEASSVIESVIDLASDGLDLYKGFMNIEDKSKFATQSSGIAGMVTGSVAVVAGAVQMTTAGIQKSHLTNATESIQKNTELSDKDKERAANAAKLQKRLLDDKQVTAGLNMAVGALNVAAGALMFTGVGATVAAVLSGVATGLSLISSVYSFFKSKSNTKKTIDEYIHMDDIYPIVQKDIESKITKEQKEKGVTPPKESKIKDYIRMEAAAQMGCIGIDDFINYITRQYAVLIHDKALLQADGKTPVAIGSDGKPVLSQTNKDFAEMLKGYGLKADYKKGKPTVNTIQKRMK